MAVPDHRHSHPTRRHHPRITRIQIDSTPRISAEIHAPRVYTSLDMSTSTISVDEFQALEQKVLRAVEIVKREREARAAAEAEVASLRAQLEAQRAAQAEALSTAQSQLNTLNQERDAVRQRVEKMLQQMDELL
jgi:hypothetical protein